MESEMTNEEFEYVLNYFLHLLPEDVKHNYYYPYLSPSEIDEERKRLVGVLKKDYNSEIFYNLCKKCGGLARTPKAKQCRFCGFDWH